MKSLFNFIFLIELATCIEFGSNDVGLNPGRIFWSKNTWFSNSIELSQTNAGSTVTMTFHIMPSSTLTAASIDLIFPSTFSSSTMVTLPTIYSLTADRDTSIIYSITLPGSPGLHGPFGIVTRSFSTGKIVDVNYNFGCVAVTSSVPASSLLVRRISSMSTINTDNTLEFEFSLTLSLWAYDIIEIVPDTPNGNLWVLKTGLTCKSVGDSNILWGPDSNTTLPCSLGKKSSQSTGVANMGDNNVAEDSIYIYGISSDAYASISNSYTIKIDVSSITSPTCVTSSSAWIINVWRFGTNNLLAKYSTSAGPGSTAGTASFLSWNSINFPSNKVIVGQTLFTKLTVSTNNPLPAGSCLVVTFSGVNIYNTVWWQDTNGSNAASAQCYAISPTDGTSCTTTDAITLTLSFSKIQAKGAFSVVLLSYFYSTVVPVTKIASYYGSTTSTAVVDESESNPGAFIINANASPTYLISDLALHSLSPTTIYPQLTLANGAIPSKLATSTDHQYGGDKTQDIFIRVTPGSSNTWGGGSGYAANVVLYFPKASTFEFNNFGSVYIDNDATRTEHINTISLLTTLATTALTLTTNAITVSASTTNQVSLSFTSSTDSVSSAESYILRYSTSGKISLPFIASNLGTFYEVWAIASYTVTTIATIEIGSAVFSVLSYPGSTSLFTKQACAAEWDGIPLVNYFAPINIDFDFSVQLYAIDIVIDKGYHFTKGFLATGIMAKSDNTGSLTYGTQFTSTSFAIPTAIFVVSGNQVILTLKGLGSISSGASVTTFFPSATRSLGQNPLSIDTYFYFTKSPDASIRQVLYQTKGYSQSVNTANTNTFDSTEFIGVTDPLYRNIGESLTVTITQKLQAATNHDISANSYIGIGLPIGYTFSSPVISLKIDAEIEYTPAPLLFYIPSQDQNHYGGFILGTRSSGTSWGAATSTPIPVVYDLQVSNLKPPNYSGNGWITAWIADKGSLGGACTYSQSYGSSIISALKLSTPTCVSNSGSVIGRSADSINLSMTFAFTTTIALLKGGWISFTMDDSWIWPITVSSYTSLLIKGTYSIDINKILTVTLADNLKAGSYAITVTGVAPPINSGYTSLDKDCFTALITKTSNGDTIESWSTSDEAGYQTSVGPSSI